MPDAKTWIDNWMGRHGLFTGNRINVSMVDVRRMVDELLEHAGQEASGRKLAEEVVERQRKVIIDLESYEDAVECLRDIGRQTGCDHVDDPDGRQQLVNCVEQVIDAASQRAAELRATLDQIADLKPDYTNPEEYHRRVRELSSRVVQPTSDQVEETRHEAAGMSPRVEHLATELRELSSRFPSESNVAMLARGAVDVIEDLERKQQDAVAILKQNDLGAVHEAISRLT